MAGFSPERHPRLMLVLALGVGFALTLLLRLLPEEGRRLTLTPVVQEVIADPGSPWSGARNPDVTVVVFTDYLCPLCKQTDPALGRLLADDPRVRVIWKDWPIRGEMSEYAAVTALAAERQGRYREVHDALMAARGELTPQRVDAIAEAAGADLARLAADRTEHADEIHAQLARHSRQAFGLGLPGTPSYLVGPYLLVGALDDRRLRQAVDRARRVGPPRP